MKLPTLYETALGAFLHDMGKFLQRAYGGNQALSPQTKNLDSVLLPLFQGRYSHWHVLWTEEFLDRMGARFPKPLDKQSIRNMAVFHHKPDGANAEVGAAAWIVAEADRISSGMERKELDEQVEAEGGRKGWDRFIKTALKSPFAAVDLGNGRPTASELPLEELCPGEALMPQQRVDTSDYQSRYAALWRRMEEELHALPSDVSPDLYCEVLLSLSERFLSTVPSSTIDQPDISLHDHARVAAALAAALHAWHESKGNLNDEAAIKDRDIKKFRFVAGDLSGIQSSLFQLANQQVRGVNKILRARSFLLGMLTEAAVLLCRRELNLTPFSLLQNAGGRFLLLAPDLDDVEERVDRVRKQIHVWIWKRYRGELSLNVCLSEPFEANALMPDRLHQTLRMVSEAVDDAKLRAFDGCFEPVHRDLRYEHGVCKACNARPAERPDSVESGLPVRCSPCADEHELGGRLTRAAWLHWTMDGNTGLEFFGGLRLMLSERRPRTTEQTVSLVRFYGRDEGERGTAVRFVANYVPRLQEGDVSKPAYAHLSEEARSTEVGDIKTFEHLSLDALEAKGTDLRGLPLLAVLKADVDRLGEIFSRGVKVPTLSRTAALSRSLDFFFTGYLMHLLQERYPDTYTVYAGGDDLLLVGPWFSTIRLAKDMREQFLRWTGNNPNITISAGIELMKVNHPINRVAAAAEERLEAAKKADRNRISVIDRKPVSWEELNKQLQLADQLDGYLQNGVLSSGFVYNLLSFEEDKLAAEEAVGRGKGVPLAAATWRARLGYQIARHLQSDRANGDSDKSAATKLVCELLRVDEQLTVKGRGSAARIPVSIALYRNRSGKEN